MVLFHEMESTKLYKVYHHRHLNVYEMMVENFEQHIILSKSNYFSLVHRNHSVQDLKFTNTNLLNRNSKQIFCVPFVLLVSVELLIASKILSAASMPDFIAVCVPLIFGTFKNPGLQPAKQPPGNESLGTA